MVEVRLSMIVASPAGHIERLRALETLNSHDSRVRCPLYDLEVVLLQALETLNSHDSRVRFPLCDLEVVLLQAPEIWVLDSSL